MASLNCANEKTSEERDSRGLRGADSQMRSVSLFALVFGSSVAPSGVAKSSSAGQPGRKAERADCSFADSQTRRLPDSLTCRLADCVSQCGESQC